MVDVSMSVFVGVSVSNCGWMLSYTGPSYMGLWVIVLHTLFVELMNRFSVFSGKSNDYHALSSLYLISSYIL